MKTMWKLPLPHSNALNIVAMPKGSEVHYVAADARGVDPATIWFEVPDTHAETEERRFHVVGTGIPIPATAGRYVGSCQSPGGMFIWHVFEPRQ